MNPTRNPFRINVGFILHEEVGYSYDFEFDLPRATLGSDLELRGFSGRLSMGRTPQGLISTGEFSGAVDLACVRCLTAFEKELSFSMTELFSTNPKSKTESGLIVPEDARIDLQPLLREYALLEIPIKPLCREDCKGLCPVCGQDLNVSDCGHRPDAGDSPFASLGDFLQK